MKYFGAKISPNYVKMNTFNILIFVGIYVLISYLSQTLESICEFRQNSNQNT